MSNGMTALVIIALLTVWFFGFTVGYGIRGRENEWYYLNRERVRQYRSQAEDVPEIIPAGGFGGIFMTTDERSAS